VITVSADRVTSNTAPELNARIQRQIERNLAYFAENPEEIGQRLDELDEEWDIERVLETGSSVLSLSGLVLGIGVSRKWLLIPLAVQGFFLQHALQGWCPPLPLFRRLGFRTQAEIDDERHALIALRDEAGFGGISDEDLAARTVRP
jgi:hypothetical protein